MLTHMAQGLSLFFISKNIIKEEDKEIYDYSFEILLSTLINLLAMIIMAVVSGTMLYAIFFLFGFSMIRSTAGGYHAETHLGCFLILVGSFATYLIMLLMLPNLILKNMTIIFCTVSYLLVVIFSPVEDYNKPFTKEEYKKFKIKSNASVIIASIIAIMLVVVFGKFKWGFSIATGMCVVSLSLIAGTVKNRLRASIQNGRKGV